MTLVETMVGAVTLVMVVGGVMTFTFFTARSFAAMTNYVDLDSKSRNALDRMTIQTTDPASGAIHTLQYSYDPTIKSVIRTFDSQTNTLLKECTLWNAALCQRNATNATFGNAFSAVSTSRPDECKVIQLTWVCSRNILGKMANTESVQSAHVVIRKK